MSYSVVSLLYMQAFQVIFKLLGVHQEKPFIHWFNGSMSFKFISSDDLAGFELTQGLFVQKGFVFSLCFPKIPSTPLSPFPNLSLVLLQAKQGTTFS